MFHTLSTQEIARRFKTDIEKGLDDSQVRKYIAKYGPNSLPEPRKPSLFLKFLSQFTDLLVLILLFATVIAFFLGETIDALAILAIVIINASIGFFQEIQAERTIKALAEKEILYAIVLRDGQIQKINASDLVPGDILVIEEGAKIPADARIIESFSLKADESILTGESTPVYKNHKNLSSDHLPLADRINMVYKNTKALSGRGKAIVIATGKKTEIGKIATTLETTKKEKTPLTIELEKVAKLLTVAIGVIAISIFGLNFLARVPFIESLLVSISLAVAAIPEGLPAIVTIVLSLGVKRLAEKKSIVRRLSSVETLGSVRIIAADKTGTLTQNKINVVKIILSNGGSYTVEGHGYNTIGTFFDKNKNIIDVSKRALFYKLLLAGVLANDAALKIKEQDKETEVIGDTTEGALLVVAERANLYVEKIRGDYPRVNEIPFSSERKMMSVVVDASCHSRNKAGTGSELNSKSFILFVKGAPEVVIEKTNLSPDQKKEFLKKTQQLTYQGLRTLAIAQKELTKKHVSSKDETSLEFLGLVGMHDPLRPEVSQALKVAKKAGISTIMITGDHQDTALSIAVKAGICQKEGKVLTDREVAKLEHKKLVKKIKQGISVFARISPLSKLKIVEAIKSIPHTQVAVTGDGVNDALALKSAHIGVAMGRTGTDLTREVADIVLTDDNYATIVTAIEQGRVIYANLVKFIRYLISCNLAEVLVVTLGVVMGTPLPLFPIQILWINLITDSLPALALGVEPPEADVMKLPPRDPSLGILHKVRLVYMTAEGMVMGLAVFILFLYALVNFSYPVAQSMTFAALAISQLVHAFNNRSTRKSLFSLGIFTNRWLLLATGISFVLQLISIQTPLGNIIFKTVSLSLYQWLIIGFVSLIPLIFVELKKLLRFRLLP